MDDLAATLFGFGGPAVVQLLLDLHDGKLGGTLDAGLRLLVWRVFEYVDVFIFLQQVAYHLQVVLLYEVGAGSVFVRDGVRVGAGMGGLLFESVLEDPEL
jgi:hypothetical protein